jgi:hypothetical protein
VERTILTFFWIAIASSRRTGICSSNLAADVELSVQKVSKIQKFSEMPEKSGREGQARQGGERKGG